MTPFSTLEDVKRRAAEAVVAQSGLSHRGLAQEIRRLLVFGDANTGAILQRPVLEGAHPFVTAEETFGNLSGSLLHPDLVEVLDAASDPRPREYRFERGRHPFRHQLQAWHALITPEPRSIVVTSGTGSGKTECFLIPILNDLVARARPGSTPLVGVEAIMLYPLNALIESQKERLSEWTAPFGGRVRYCLYNGNLPENAPASQSRATPWEVIDRACLRAAPPPILVTNVTMLEYMLARSKDAPILAASRGKLKWIVLDEAHTLVGAAAAEVALLLRRVLLAFGVGPEQVRFIATSATIGSGEHVREELGMFLAAVAGLPRERVEVIEGARRMPPRPRGPTGAPPPVDLTSIGAHELYDRLVGRAEIWRLVECLHRGAVSAADFASAARSVGLDPADLAAALSRARSRPTNGGEGDVLAPLRVHAFERAVPGLWSCINKSCQAAPTAWPFGRVLTERAERCPSCSMPVLEIVSCTSCGAPFLEGEERGGRLSAKLRTPPIDEFRDEAERERGVEQDEAEDAEDKVEPSRSAVTWTRLFAATPTAKARPLHLDVRTGVVVDAPIDGALTLLCDEPDQPTACPCCGEAPREGRALRPLIFGAPFLMGNAAPLLLEGVGPAGGANGPLPSGGRRLLSFTDSRQGTARLSAKLETESERNFVRSLVYHMVQAALQPAQGAEWTAEKVRSEVGELEKIIAAQPHLASILKETLEAKRAELAKLNGGDESGLAWSEMVNRLAERVEVASWIKDVWAGRDEHFEDTTQLACFLLLREFARRPKRANSIETMGLARLSFPEVEGLGEARLPSPFRRRGRTIADWRDYLDALLTHWVRANGAIGIEQWLQNWILPKGRLKRLAGPDEAPQTRGDRSLLTWPGGSMPNPRSRPVALLIAGLKLDLSSSADRDDLDECLRSAWDQLRGPLTWSGAERRALAFDKARIAPLTNAFWCPITRRPLDRAAFELTPYGLDRAGRPPERALPMIMPRLPAPIVASADRDAARAAVRDWLAVDKHVADLRERGAWTNISDRIALFSDYARAAEHSAQQDPGTLRRYEAEFKAGRINVLNCSTTMEMGVDIGSVSTVMMTNVPPSIASYRQRVGRAGRRGQALSLAFTFCKDRPLDREAFRNPFVFLNRGVAAPRVALDSRPIVQRHVNAYLLAAFVREGGGETMSTIIGDFFGCPSTPEAPRRPENDRPSALFAAWLERQTTREAHRDGIATITRGSIIEGDRGAFDEVLNGLREVEKDFVAEWQGIGQQARDEGTTQAARTSMSLQLRRLTGEFLLGALAERGFLPGHGFPTDVVSFLTDWRTHGQQEPVPGENRLRGRGGPQRPLDIAIRDYAPGSEVVIDGIVYRSRGVTLNWKKPATVEGVAEVQSLRTQWGCLLCGAAGIEAGSRPEACPDCGEADLRFSRFLRPAGFTIDTREKPHAHVEEVVYIPPKDPCVSARGVPWAPLPDPRRGRMRASREGLVYYSSVGASGHGYGICLDCGRAAEEEGEPGAPLPDALKDHFPLRRRSGREDGRCPGNERPWAIQRHLALGHEITTDVFEIQPAHPIGEPAAYALAIALREALAQELGIEAQEMGFAVASRRSPLGARVRSLLLYDRAAGGAGFSVSAENRLRAMLKGAKRILDCHTPGCEHACSACVLVSDAPDGPGALDRKAALAFLDQHLILPEALDAEDRFAIGAEICDSILDEVNAALIERAQAQLTIWLTSQSDAAAMAEWNIDPSLSEWRYRGRRMRLVLPDGAIRRLDAAQLLALRDFASRHALELATGSAPAFDNGARALCAVEGPRGIEIWASRETAVGEPGPSWGRPVEHPTARARLDIDLAAVPLAPDALVPPPGAQVRDITDELDGPMEGFGRRAAALIESVLNRAGAWPNSPIAAFRYQDPYVTSPLVVRLCLDTLAALATRSSSERSKVDLETAAPRVKADAGLPREAWHDWRDVATQAGVVSAYAAELGLDLQVTCQRVPHGRFLTITFANGTKSRIILDQGLGAWGLPSSVRLRHDFAAPPVVQAKAMVRWNALLCRRRSGPTYLVGLRQS